MIGLLNAKGGCRTGDNMVGKFILGMRIEQDKRWRHGCTGHEQVITGNAHGLRNTLEE